MSNLAQKYRPTTLDDVVGQDYIKQILKNQIAQNKLRNAYLFCGGSGQGKTTIGRAFATAINGTDKQTIELDCASNNGVDDIRNIINETRTKPLFSKYKIFILDECQSLTLSSNNALLKVLEEPLSTNIFILCTTNPEKLLPTIKTRVQTFRFNGLTIEQIKDRLRYIATQENIVVDDKSLLLLSNRAKGSMRQAIQYLEMCADYGEITEETIEKCLGTSNEDVFNKLLWAFYGKDANMSIKIIEESHTEPLLFIRNFEEFIIEFIKYQYDNTRIVSDLIKDTASKISLGVSVGILKFIRVLVKNLTTDTHRLQTLESLIILKFNEV